MGILKNRKIIRGTFGIPLIVFCSIFFYLLIGYIFDNLFIAKCILFFGIFIGSVQSFIIVFSSIVKREFALDYIAVLTIIVSLIAKEYLVCAVIVLMLSGGNALEDYGRAKAKQSLTKLVERIPNKVLIWHQNKPGYQVRIESVNPGQEIYVRKGEVIPLDGVLISDSTRTDESSLTGEPFLLDKLKGDQMRSGTLNMGEAIVIKVTRSEKNSGYGKIIEMVKKAQEEKPKFIRIADKYSVIFTIVTILIAGFAYYFTGSLEVVLAVLVIATPCPLILAAPIALLGGMNAAAKKRIIIKNLSSLEKGSKVDTIVFDKTGTLTIGSLVLGKIMIKDRRFNAKEVLSIAEAIERSSLHPIAKSIVIAARKARVHRIASLDVKEVIGSHIEGIVNGKRYFISRSFGSTGKSLTLREGRKEIAEFHFEEELKKDTMETIKNLENEGFKLLIYTGDKKEAADEMGEKLGGFVEVRAELSPKDKTEGIANLKRQKNTVAMIGDGINDAPSLAIADVGMVFSNEEHTAASEAADIVFLGGNLSEVSDALNISKNSLSIAKQSIFFGIGLSTLGMVVAAFGFIIPLAGAIIQEVIDVAVIFNALRASK